MTDKEDRYLINSVLRAAQILQSFTVEKTSLSNAELAKKLGLNKSSVTRLLYSLERAQFIQRDTKNGRYSLAHKIHQIADVYQRSAVWHEACRPILKDLSARYNENVHMGVIDNWQVRHLEEVKCSQPVGLMPVVGSQLPAYCTGIGKTILAHLPAEEFDAFCRETELVRYTPLTITDPEKLRKQLAIIRKNGHAITRGEFRPDVLAVTAPVRNAQGVVITAISLAGPMFRMDIQENIKDYIEAVKATAEKISERVAHLKSLTD